jgi:arylamine N-acetyltransferase
MASAYSTSQLAQWEEYVGLPQKYRHSSKPELNPEYLEALHLHQIARVPYENLDLHYTTHRSISLDPQVHFQKIVGDARGRGGYCMEGNLLYNHMLKAAGFDVYTAGVRIRMRVDGVPGGDYIGW